MLKRSAAAVMAAVMMLSLSSCGKKDDSSKAQDIIIDATEIKYDTQEVKVGSIGSVYDIQNTEFDYPYKEYVYIKQNGIIGKLYTGETVEEGQLICELISDDLTDELETQKVVTDSAKETYDNMVASGITGAELEKAKVIYELEQNNYNKLLDKASLSKIYAPCSGRITMNGDELHAGMQVQAGQYLCEIADTSSKYLCAFVNNAPIENVNFGSKVEVAQMNGEPVEGKVVDIITVEGGVYGSGVNYVIDLPEGTEFNDFGAIHVYFSVNYKENTIVIDQRALKSSGGRQYVNVLVDGTKVEMDVETGIVDKNGRKVEIISGLEGGEQLIVNTSND